MHQHLALNFHDDTLTTANESQNISETSNSDQSLSSTSTKKLCEKMKDLLENRRNKKLRGSYQKNTMLEQQRSKSFMKKYLKELNMKIKCIPKLCMAYNETWHTWHKQCQKHWSLCPKPLTKAHLAHQFQQHHGKIFQTFLWLQNLFLQWHHHLILIILAVRHITMDK